MVEPTLWGPSTWQMLFMCTWNAPPHQMARLIRLVECIGELLPCDKCRRHFAANRTKVNRRAGKIPIDTKGMLFWLYCLKDEINKSLRKTSISYDELMNRCIFHGAVVDDVMIADTLVIFAISALDLRRVAEFLELCTLLTELLPVPHDAELKRYLPKVSETFLVSETVKVARACRVERGLQPLATTHYQSLI